MKLSQLLISLFLVLFQFSCSHKAIHENFEKDLAILKTNDPNKENKPYVVMISIDGFRHDYLDLYNPPFLSTVHNRGFRVKSLEPIFPSKTFPNHYSLITGLYSDSHKLVANRFYDPERKEDYLLGKPTTRDGSWYDGEPLWTSIKKQGLLTASYFWVGSDANIHNSHPSYFYNYDHGTANEKRTQQIVEWLKMPKETRPHFLTLYFSIVDSAGHRYGPRSSEVKESVLEVDKLISNLVNEVDKLKLPVNFVIVSDHGMKTIDPKRNIFVGDYIETDLITFHEQGPLTLGYFAPQTTKKQKSELYQKLKNIPGARLFKRENRPKRWHYSKLPRQGDFLLLVDNGAYIFPEKRPSDFKSKTGGTHGYDPKESPEMDGIFMSFGPNVLSSGIIPRTKNINVYPYVMDLLGLEVKAKIDGSSQELKRYLKN